MLAEVQINDKHDPVDPQKNVDQGKRRDKECGTFLGPSLTIGPLGERRKTDTYRDNRRDDRKWNWKLQLAGRTARLRSLLENVAERTSADAGIFEEVEAIFTSEALIGHIFAGLAVVRTCEALLAGGGNRYSRARFVAGHLFIEVIYKLIELIRPVTA